MSVSARKEIKAVEPVSMLTNKRYLLYKSRVA